MFIYTCFFIILAANDDDFNLQSDCFVCTILTHGEEGVVYGTDDKVEVKVLLEPFKGNNCRGLVGKPKIFFIQVRLFLNIMGLVAKQIDLYPGLPLTLKFRKSRLPTFEIWKSH